MAKAKYLNRKVGVKVSNNVKEAIEAAGAGSDIILIDNLAPNEVGKTVNSLVERKLGDKVLLKVSGRITPGNAASYAKTGIDAIPAGYLTHLAKALNVSLEIMG